MKPIFLSISSRLMFAKDLFFKTFHFRGHLEVVIFEQNQMISHTEIWERVFQPERAASANILELDMLGMFMKSKVSQWQNWGKFRSLRGCLIWVLEGE